MIVRLGMDVGGTAVKLGLVTAEGAVTARAAVPFNPAQDFEGAAGAMCAAAARLLGDRKPEAVGIATPGYTDPATGILVDGGHNVPSLREYSLPAFVASRLGAPAFIDNDGVCATLGEMRLGAGQPFHRFALITIGTGIGGGVVVDRRVVTGAGGLPSEIGALCLDPDGPTNYSGIPGSFERLASAAALVESYLHGSGRPDAVSAAEVLRLAASHDPIAEAAVDGVARRIAQAFGIMTNLLNLEACIIGGGVAAAGENLLAAVRRHLARFTWPSLHRNVRLLLAHHGNDAGLIGAAVMAAERLRARKIP